jgi:transcriptional regulator with XRE-family HTH domain
MNKFAKTLKYLRKMNGLTQEQMAEKAKISITQYKKYELGNGYPLAEKLIGLAKFFNVPVDYLLRGEDSLFCDFATAALFKELRKMDDDKTESLFYIVQKLSELKNLDDE